MTATLTTERLVLRPLTQEDAPVVRSLCGNWAVARMLARVPHPYPEGLAEEWIAGHEADRATGTAFRFALQFESALVGVIGLEKKESGDFELGYWLGEPWWGRGLMSEAARRVVAFAFEELGAPGLGASHFLDNPASGRILESCGFRQTDRTQDWSQSRGRADPARRLVLARADYEARLAS